MQTTDLKNFIKFKLKKPQVITGGDDKGPIRRDKLKVPKHGN